MLNINSSESRIILLVQVGTIMKHLTNIRQPKAHGLTKKPPPIEDHWKAGEQHYKRLRKDNKWLETYYVDYT